MVSIYGVTCEISVVAWVGVDLNWLSLPLEIGIDYSLQHLSLYELGIGFKS